LEISCGNVASVAGCWRMKTKLTVLSVNRGPFFNLPSREVELTDDCILCNDVTMPWEFNPHTVELWVIGNEFGAIGAVWASCEQDALDALVDENLGESLLIDKEDQEQADEAEREEWAHLGNAGEPANLDNVWMQRVRLDPKQDCELLCKFAYANGAQQKSLDN
jgi:hypothetical protein